MSPVDARVFNRTVGRVGHRFCGLCCSSGCSADDGGVRVCVWRGGEGSALHIWNGGGSKDVSEEWEQNTHGSCVRNGVLVAVCSTAIHRVEDPGGEGGDMVEDTATGSISWVVTSVEWSMCLTMPEKMSMEFKSTAVAPLLSDLAIICGQAPTGQNYACTFTGSSSILSWLSTALRVCCGLVLASVD